MAGTAYHLAYDSSHHALLIHLTGQARSEVMDKVWWRELQLAYNPDHGRFDPPQHRRWGHQYSFYTEKETLFLDGLSLRCSIPRINRIRPTRLIRRLRSLQKLFAQLRRLEPTDQVVSIGLTEVPLTGAWIMTGELMPPAVSRLSNRLHEVCWAEIADLMTRTRNHLQPKVTPSVRDLALEWNPNERFVLGFRDGPAVTSEREYTPDTNSRMFSTGVVADPAMFTTLLVGMAKLADTLSRMSVQRVA